MSESSHKRSKSAIAKSLLQRVTSKNEVPTLDQQDESTLKTPIEEPEAEAEESSPITPVSPAVSQAPFRPAHRPHLSTTMSNAGTRASAEHTSPTKSIAVATSPIVQGASIEQSVRLFKVFEALRQGDTAAISKAVRSTTSPKDGAGGEANKLEGTSILHLAVQCAELPVIEFVLSLNSSEVNGKDRDGNTPLHIASNLGRVSVVKLLLSQKNINDAITNLQGKTPLELARSPEVYQHLQLARSIFVEGKIKQIQELVQKEDYGALEILLADWRVQTTVDVNSTELVADPSTLESGGTLMHEAARKRDTKLIQLLLLNGADPFKRDRRGKLPQDVTKDEKTKTILKKSPAAAIAQRGIQEKAIIGSHVSQGGGSVPQGDSALASKEAREMKGYLKKWTNYTTGYKLRWFVLEDGVLSYYKHQDDAGSACRGAINMRIAQLHMDPKDKLLFEIEGKSSVRYHLKANHQVEAKRWFWALNNAIQWSKDEAREEERRQKQEAETIRQARNEQLEKQPTREADSVSLSGAGLIPGTAVGVPLTGGTSLSGSTTAIDEVSAYEPSTAEDELGRIIGQAHTAAIQGDMDDDDEEYGDDASSHEVHPQNKDAFNITAQSAKLQLDLLSQVSSALQRERSTNPDMPIAHPSVDHALVSYDTAVQNLKGLLVDLLRISRDHEAYWQYRLDREANVRKLWEESMARVVREQEELENKIGESEDKRRRTKRALRDVLEGQGSGAPSRARSRRPTETVEQLREAVADMHVADGGAPAAVVDDDETGRSVSPVWSRRPTMAEMTNNEISDDDSDIDDEFFDAVDAGEVEVADEMPLSGPPEMPQAVDSSVTNEQDQRVVAIKKSYKGYEDGIRKRLKLDADNRPKVSLWGILKSMIGKDMTKMTLPVSFNEPTSLLYRVVEDMEYTELLDIAAERTDPTERMVYVAAFAASEYASTIGRVAKPFNPLLGETYEYVRPDKGFRFFIEQVSHHPPVGAAWAESAKWDYYGESHVKSKFYGKSFDINPTGTWFLRLRPSSGPEELYTWKKVTSSVIGIITGNPTVDNYGPMEVKNWTTGEECVLDFKPRGWKASSAYQVSGKVTDSHGKTRWSMGGRWNDKLYARLTPGYEEPVTPGHGRGDGNQAIVVWQAHERPSGIPFNLTPFVVTLNALPDRLKPIIAPTDSRLRPDQRAMEDGEYDLAATEKNRVEGKQRKKRREREAAGAEFTPRWFRKDRHPVTGEEYWKFNGEYWRLREEVAEGKAKWEDLEDIF